MVCGAKVERSALAILNCNGFYAPSSPTTIAYLTLKTESIGLKNLFKLFVSFLKDADLIGCKIIAIDGTKAERTTAKLISIKRKLETAYIEERTQEYLAVGQK
jgi:transposase